MTEHRGFLQQHHFLLRRLHSLTGIVPIGVFLIAHLVTNSSLAWGKYGLRAEGHGMTVRDGGVAYFQEEVAWINTQVPHLLLIELTLWGALFFHIVFGVMYAVGGKSNTGAYAYRANLRYKLQRWSGYLGMLFIFYHVATLRWGWTALVPSGTQWTHHFSASTLAAALQGSPEGWTAAGLIVSLFYFAGVSLLVFHFANGLWTAAITWGLTVTVQAQRRWGYACAAIGVGLMAAAWSALGAAWTTDVERARGVESTIILEEHGPDRLRELLDDHGADHSVDQPVAQTTED